MLEGGGNPSDSRTVKDNYYGVDLSQSYRWVSYRFASDYAIYRVDAEFSMMGVVNFAHASFYMLGA